MANYEDLIGEAVRMLHEHGGKRTLVERKLRERLARDRELQYALVGDELPRSERPRELPEKAIQGIHDLIDAAMRRINR